MLPKRVRQFVMNLTDRINEDDYKYVKSKLNEKEYEIFNTISKSEQKHSVRVAKEIENVINEIKKGNQFEKGYTLTNGEILDREIIFSAKKNIDKALDKNINEKCVNNDFLEIVRNHHNENYGENIVGNGIKSCENNIKSLENDNEYIEKYTKYCSNKYYLGNIIRFFQGIDDGN